MDTNARTESHGTLHSSPFFYGPNAAFPLIE
jgi:hypothetical protein